MPAVASVRLRYIPKDYWFDPNGFDVHEGDHVVVQTARGKEIGLVVEDIKEVQEADLASPLKPVLRFATDEDLARADEMNRRNEEAMETFRDLVEQHGLDMKPVRVEFMFTGDFATFYFAAEDRIDFRSLVRDLAAAFHVRVDMRQIGVRDEARMLGGLGHCGEELCCARMGGEFQPVSIRMAKEQDLPLNPSKISGLCGRLMCCLRYEFEAYKDFKGRAPKKNALIETPAGLGKVVEFDTPREQLRLRMEDGSSMVVPLSSMDCGGKTAREGERIRPCHIGDEAWDQIIEELHKDENLALLGEKLFSSDEKLVDKVAEPGTVSERTPRRRRRSGDGEKKDEGAKPFRREESAAEPAPSRTPRRRRRSVSVSGTEKPERIPAEERQQEAKAEQSKETGKESKSRPSRRRRRGSGNGGNQAKGQRQAEGQQKKSGNGNDGSKSKPRPGQNSSTLHGNKSEKTQSDNGSQKKSEASGNRNRRRRRRRGSGSGGADKGGSSAE